MGSTGEGLRRHVPNREVADQRELDRTGGTLILEDRTMSISRVAFGVAISAASLTACDGGHPTMPSAGAVALTAQTLGVARCAPGNGGFTTSFTHPYFFPATVGHQSVLEGDDHDESVRLQITVLAATRNVGGVTTRVIEEREWVDGSLLEVSWNYYAQASDGSICYYGEDVDIYQDGGIVHDGAWCGEGGNQPGIFLPAELAVGTRFQMEVAPGIALDEGRIVGFGPVEVPYDRFIQTLRVREFNPLDGDVGFKVFAQGVGLVVDGEVKLTAINATPGAPDQPSLIGQSCGS